MSMDLSLNVHWSNDIPPLIQLLETLRQGFPDHWMLRIEHGGPYTANVPSLYLNSEVNYEALHWFTVFFAVGEHVLVQIAEAAWGITPDQNTLQRVDRLP